MKKMVYGSDGENGFGTIYGIGSDDDHAYMDAWDNKEDDENVDFFCVDITDEAYNVLDQDGGNDIYDERFALVDDVFMTVGEVTVDMLAKTENGYIDLDRNRSVWLVTVEKQLEIMDMEIDKLKKEFPNTDYDTIIIFRDDGTWEVVR